MADVVAVTICDTYRLSRDDFNSGTYAKAHAVSMYLTALTYSRNYYILYMYVTHVRHLVVIAIWTSIHICSIAFTELTFYRRCVRYHICKTDHFG